MSLARRHFLAAGISAAALASGQTAATAQETKAELDVSKLGKTTHTKFAVNVEMWWTKLPFLDRLKKVAEFGYSGYEMWPYQGKDLKAIARLNEELGLECAQFTAWGFEPGMNNPANEDKFISQ